ncbi:hypothetical protein [Robiginitomaculum antarcticum]|uniref:hypothetical protein n=1 Tax=Robiginitomaculum antarcticum TaxID=437507 RepID=UPI0003A08D54|nr:hypothetical protein [Robiginitomaculum antarcticum]
MSKRLKKTKMDFDFEDELAFADNMYEAPRGAKPRGKHKRKQGNHKTAYYD